MAREGEIYGELERLGAKLEAGLGDVFSRRNYPTTIARQGSAFSVYFTDHAPRNWRDIALNNDAERDLAYRRAMIEAGVFHFPVTTKQSSISLAHTDDDIERTVAITADVVNRLS